MKAPATLPLIVRVYLENTKFDPDAVDAEIYCVNTTSSTFSIATQSESFTTIDETTGEAAEHGSEPKNSSLTPGAHVLIADVKGWEWDGHVGIEVLFREEGEEAPIIKSYNFKGSNADFTIPSTEKKGRIIPPLK
jgi:hypothetical protein